MTYPINNKSLHEGENIAGGNPSAGFASANEKVWISAGTREFRNASIALFFVGFASFSLIYCVQPLLPEFAKSFNVSPAESSLALSLTTGFLSLSIFIVGAISQMLDRRKLIFASMLFGAILNIISAITPNWHELLVARALEGFILGGVPAVAMAYIAEEIEPSHLGKSMGVYVAGTGFGAMIGRVGMGLMTEFTSWRVAMAVLGISCLISSIIFLVLLPRSRNFIPDHKLDIKFHLNAWKTHLTNLKLIRVYVIGFTLTSIFVTSFNYSTFRLAAAPFNLSPTQVSMLFLTMGFGVFASSIAGNLSDKFGKKPLLFAGYGLMLLGSLITIVPSIFTIVLGIIFITTGFFVSHAVASSSVGPIAGSAKGHAASLYLLFYYMGSSIIGSIGGWFWRTGGWDMVVVLTSSFAILGIVLTANIKLVKK